MNTTMPCAETGSIPARPAKKRFNMKKWAPYIFISPFFILFAVFSLFPLLFSIYLSFNQWEAASGVEAMQWVGLDNYKYALSDPWFLRSLGNTVWLALASGVPQHLVAIPLAAFIHHSFKRSRNLVIGIYFLPFITSSVASPSAPATASGSTSIRGSSRVWRISAAASSGSGSTSTMRDRPELCCAASRSPLPAPI